LTVLATLALAGFALTACAQPYRSGTAKPTAVTQPPAGVAPSAVPGAVPVPESAQGGKPDANSAQYRADLESCYNFAQARIAHDQRIESDSSAAFDAYPSGIGVAELSGRMSEFANRNRRSLLYGDCMRAKGYSQN
jgi:hypothetical protein